MMTVHSSRPANAAAALLSTVPAVQPRAPQARLTRTAMPRAAPSRPGPGSGPAAGETDPVVISAISPVDRPAAAKVRITLVAGAAVTASAWPRAVPVRAGACSREVLMVRSAQ